MFEHSDSFLPLSIFEFFAEGGQRGDRHGGGHGEWRRQSEERRAEAVEGQGQGPSGRRWLDGDLGESPRWLQHCVTKGNRRPSMVSESNPNSWLTVLVRGIGVDVLVPW